MIKRTLTFNNGNTEFDFQVSQEEYQRIIKAKMSGDQTMAVQILVEQKADYLLSLDFVKIKQ